MSHVKNRDCLFGSLKGNVQHGFKKLRLRRWNSTGSWSPEPSGIIDLTNFHLTDGNYTKRKHVFKLTTNSCPPGSPSISSIKSNERELLLQAENEHDMKVWMSVLGNVCRTNSTSNISSDFLNGGGQMAEPQTMPAMQTVQSSADEFSPVLSNKSQRKYTFDSRSPSGQSPVTKSRKTPLTPNAASGSQREGSDKETGSPKSKTWKGIVARQFRRIGGTHNQEPLPPEGVSFGVPLHMCPPSLENPYVPIVLARCIEIVEARGLSVVGIYRIPGNTAAITQLTEQINRGLDEQTLNDPRWDDVNVVSSLLKSFIRNLPEPILPGDTYNRFIEADKLTGVKRLQELKILLKKLPPYSYETLKHLMKHLHRVSQNCLVNLMEPRNVAIVFGPSVIRSSNDNLATAVKDMRHQCQIVEALVSHFPFFFENDSLPEINETNATKFTESTLETQSKNLLLDNVHKIESTPSYKESKEHSSRFVANIVQAANRKIRRTAQRKSNISSTVSSADTVSLDSTTSAESKGQRKLSYLSDSSGGNNKLSHTSALAHSDMVHPSSEDDSNDSAFNDNGSMSLKTVTVTLDNKLRTLRDSNIDANTSIIGGNNENVNPSGNKNYHCHLRPLTLGENIPYADESPERPLRAKPLRILNNNNNNNTMIVSEVPKPAVVGDAQTEFSSSSDTDTSTTSNPREKLEKEDIRNEMREMSRMLFNLERKASNLERKIHLNRSLSLNYKNHKNTECCCRLSNTNSNNLHNSTLGIRSRLSLTKDEKTDKNISKRRQLLDINPSPSDSTGHITSGTGTNITSGSKSRRHSGKDRSIRRRHTVGGSHDYYLSNKHGAMNDCERYIATDASSNTLKIDD